MIRYAYGKPAYQDVPTILGYEAALDYYNNTKPLTSKQNAGLRVIGKRTRRIHGEPVVMVKEPNGNIVVQKKSYVVSEGPLRYVRYHKDEPLKISLNVSKLHDGVVSFLCNLLGTEITSYDHAWWFGSHDERHYLGRKANTGYNVARLEFGEGGLKVVDSTPFIAYRLKVKEFNKLKSQFSGFLTYLENACKVRDKGFWDTEYEEVLGRDFYHSWDERLNRLSHEDTLIQLTKNPEDYYKASLYFAEICPHLDVHRSKYEDYHRKTPIRDNAKLKMIVGSLQYFDELLKARYRDDLFTAVEMPHIGRYQANSNARYFDKHRD